MEKSELRSGWLYKVRIEHSGCRTRIWLDDEEVKGCTAADVVFRVNEVPTVVLQFVSTDVEIYGEDLKVVDVSKAEEPADAVDET